MIVSVSVTAFELVLPAFVCWSLPPHGQRPLRADYSVIRKYNPCTRGYVWALKRGALQRGLRVLDRSIIGVGVVRR